MHHRSASHQLCCYTDKTNSIINNGSDHPHAASFNPVSAIIPTNYYTSQTLSIQYSIHYSIQHNIHYSIQYLVSSFTRWNYVKVLLSSWLRHDINSCNKLCSDSGTCATDIVKGYLNPEKYTI